jgi:hypothetical protein
MLNEDENDVAFPEALLGVRLKRRRMLDVLRSVEVGEVMEMQVETVPTTMRLAALAR